LEKGRMRPWHLLALARDGDVGRDDLRRHARRVSTAERERLADEPLGTEPRGPPADELLPHTGEHIGRERERDGGIDQGTPWPRPRTCVGRARARSATWTGPSRSSVRDSMGASYTRRARPGEARSHELPDTMQLLVQVAEHAVRIEARLGRPVIRLVVDAPE